jgi:hypothetical protein
MNMNTKRVGFAGLAIGGTAIIASVGALFKLLSSPAYLVSLYWAVSHLRHHTATANDDLVLAQCIGALVAIVGAFVVAILLSWLGMPSTVPTPPSNDGNNIIPLTPPQEERKAA